MFGSELKHSLAVEPGQGIRNHEDGIRTVPYHRGKRGSEVLGLTHAKRLYLETQRPRRRFRIFVAPGHPKIVCVPQHANLAQARNRIFEDLQPLGRELGCDFADAGDFAARASQAINQARRNRVGPCDRNHRAIRAVFDDTSRSVGVRDHYVCLALQVVNEPRQSVRVCFSCPPLEKQRASNHVAALGEPSCKPDNDLACVGERRSSTDQSQTARLDCSLGECATRQEWRRPERKNDRPSQHHLPHFHCVWASTKEEYTATKPFGYSRPDSGSFTSFPPSRRVRSAPRADIRLMPAFMCTRPTARPKINHRSRGSDGAPLPRPRR